MHNKTFKLARRDAAPGLSNTMATLLAVLVGLLILAVLLVGTLILLRQRRKARRAAMDLSLLKENRASTSSVRSCHRRVRARPPPSIHVLQEKQPFEDYIDSPVTPNTLPEIRITFPEEVDSTGKRQSGRVIVVHVGDGNGDHDAYIEQLPSYQQCGNDRFQSIDLERVGGLEEKEARSVHGWS